LLQNLDFIYLFHGVSFFFLGTACLILYLRERSKKNLPWHFLSIFGFFQGLRTWLDMLSLSFGDPFFMFWVRSLLLVFSFTCLSEFSIQSLGILKNIKARLAFYVLVSFVFVLVNFFFGQSFGTYRYDSLRYLIGSLGFLLVGFALWRFSSQKTAQENKIFYRLVAICFFFYAFDISNVIFQSGFLSAPQFKKDFSFGLLGISLLVMRSFLLNVIALIFLYAMTRITLHNAFHNVRGIKYVRYIVTTFLILYLLFLLLGYRLVVTVDKHERQQLIQLIVSDAKLLADALGPIDSSLMTARYADTPLYPKFLEVHHRMMELADVAPYVRSLYLVAFNQGQLSFVVGSRMQIYPYVYQPPIASKVPEKAILDAFYSKQPTVDMPLGGLSRYFEMTYSVFVPLVDREGAVVSLLGVELDAKKVEAQIAEFRLYVILILMMFFVLLVLGHAFLMFFLLKSIELEIQKNNLNKALANLKEAEAELARSEETFRGILNNSPNAIFGFDRDLRLIFWNLGSENLYGYLKPEVVDEKNPLLSKKFTVVLGIESLDAEIQKVFLNKTFQWEMVHATKFGNFDASMTLFPVKDPLGHILFGIGLVQDISEHKRFEEKLQEAHAKIKTVLDGATQVAMIALDLKGVITVFNTGAEKMLGYSALEAIGKPIFDLAYLQADVFAFKEALAKKFGASIDWPDYQRNDILEELAKEREVTWRHKDLNLVPVELAFTPLKNEKGGFVGYLAVAINLSKRKALETISQESQKKYEDLVENLNIGIFRTEPEYPGHFIYVNSVFAKLTDAAHKEELYNIQISDFYKNKIDRENFINRLKSHGIVQNEEIQGKTLKGKPFWALVSAELKKDKNGSSYVDGIFQDITELKKMEQNLYDERDRLRTIAASIGAGLFLINKDYEIVWANETSERWFGEIESYQGQKCFQVYRFLDHVCHGCPTKKTFETGLIQTAEERTVFPDGKIMDLLISSSPIKNEKGEVEQVLELALDITDRKRTVELLEYERALSKNIIDSISDALIVIDCNNKKIVDSNRIFLVEAGLKKEDVVGKTCDQVRSYFCPSCDQCGFDQVVREGQVILSTHMHQDKDGHKVFVDVTLAPLRDEKGQIIGVINVARNVTNRKKMEEELRKYSQDLETLIKERTRALEVSEQMFRKLFESAMDGIIIRDAETKIVIDVNPSLLLLLECGREEILGLDCRVISLFETSNIFEKIDEQLKHTTSVFFDDVSIKTCTGREAVFEIRSSLYFVENRKVIQSNLRDVTERKKIEKIKAEFVSMVSHELRTPLSAIKEGVEIVADGTQGSIKKSQSECLNIALSNINRLNRLIGDILDISKIQSNLLRINLVACDVSEVVDQVYGLLKIEIEKHGMIFLTDLEKKLPLVMADKDRLNQILLNLLNNALKFTREKSKITLSCYRNGGFVEFSVRDEGPGISESEISRLFGKFVQLDSGLVRRAGGTGLGLYISRNLVEAMGGVIWAESKLGHGSVFKFTIPIKE
jgi:PAS domain S-box-containing protein